MQCLSHKGSWGLACIFILILSAQTIWTDSLSYEFQLQYALMPGIKDLSFEEIQAEFPGQNWVALKADPQSARSWRQAGNPLHLKLQYELNHWTVYLNGGLNRDFKAWYDDPSGSNLPLSADQLNINANPEAWVRYQGDFLDFQLGQFRPEFGPSPERGVSISGAPFHRGFLSSLKFPLVKFSWLWSSLDPYMSSTEREFQNTSPISNARGEVYNQEVKNLLVHRLDFHWHSLELGLMESMIIGGHNPQLWEVQPFTVYHNNYPDGYGNTMLSIDLNWQVDERTQLYGELALDDLTGGNAESSQNSSNISSWILGYSYERQFMKGLLQTRAEYIHVDPAFGNRDLTLLEFTSREVLRSNFIPFENRLSQTELFSDTYVIDHPIGYFRGPDVRDFWWELAWKQEPLKESFTWTMLQYEMGYLQKGVYDFNTTLGTSKDNPSGPTSPRQFEWRHRLVTGFQLPYDMNLKLGGIYRNLYGRVLKEHEVVGTLQFTKSIY